MIKKLKKPKNKIIEFGITSSCNYNCSYCIGVNNKERKLSKKEILKDSKKIEILLKNTLKKIKGNWIFNFGGPGEPFLIPNFFKLVKKIIRNGHKIGIVSNFSASLKNLTKFCEITGNNLVQFNASLHLEQANIDEFFKKAVLINKKIGRRRFSVLSVARKNKIIQLSKIGEKFRKEGIVFSMQLEKKSGKKGYQYPRYNKEEGEIIRSFRSNICSRNDLIFKGKNCWSGCQYFIVDREGGVWRCYPAQKDRNKDGYLGNLIDKSFNLKEGPTICPYPCCFCITPIVFKLIEGSEE